MVSFQLVCVKFERADKIARRQFCMRGLVVQDTFARRVTFARADTFLVETLLHGLNFFINFIYFFTITVTPYPRSVTFFLFLINLSFFFTIVQKCPLMQF